MNNIPLVSVVIPCYNHEKYVQDCIQSVINQTYQNIELIIIDDGSKDRSVEKIQEMIEKCQKRFVRFEFRNRPNKGLSATLNESLEWCNGEYFSAIASDDMMLPSKTECQVNFLEKNSNSIGVFGGIILLWEERQKNRVLKRKDFGFKDILLHNHELPAPTAMVRTQNIRETGGYQADLAIEDWYMWLKLTESGRVLSYLSIPLCYYRQHLSNTSQKSLFMNNQRCYILDKFSSIDSKSLRKAKANCFLVLANDTLLANRKESFKSYLEYLKLSDFRGFLDIKSVKYLVKFIMEIRLF